MAATKNAESKNMTRLQAIIAELPEWERVDIEAWDNEPSFRVRNKNFVFADSAATGVTVKLSKDEAAAVVASDGHASPCSYGLGRHGWVSINLGSRPNKARWDEVREWVRTSYTMVAPKKLARVVLEEDGLL